MDALATVISPADPEDGRTRARRSSAALDQWRGLALLCVLISHGFFFTNRVPGIGRVGVNLFFFISGILVFRSLEKLGSSGFWARSGAFWKHRLRRLYPALLAYALTLLPLVAWWQERLGLPPHSDVHTYVRALPQALSYLTNYFPATPPALGHLWSVACEMQFYLLAPLLYAAGQAAGRRRMILWASVLAMLLALGILGSRYPEQKYEFQFAVWPMMLGFCGEARREWVHRLPGSWIPWLARAGLATGVAVLALAIFDPRLKLAVVATGTLLLVPCWLSYVAGLSWPGPLGAGLRWIGERTYSIYLWQQPLTLCGYLPELLRPLGAALAVPLGGVWFHFFERPFLSKSRRQVLEVRL